MEFRRDLCRVVWRLNEWGAPIELPKTFHSRHYCLWIGWGYSQQRANVGMPPISMASYSQHRHRHIKIFSHQRENILMTSSCHVSSCIISVLAMETMAMDKISVDKKE